MSDLPKSRLSDAFMHAGSELGYSHADINGGESIGKSVEVKQMYTYVWYSLPKMVIAAFYNKLHAQGKVLQSGPSVLSVPRRSTRLC